MAVAGGGEDKEESAAPADTAAAEDTKTIEDNTTAETEIQTQETTPAETEKKHF